MAKKKKAQFVDLGRVESEIFEPMEEVKTEFDEAAQLGSAGETQMLKKLREHHATSPTLSGGDVDAAWEDADVGEESVGGENPTPDQNVVDELGEAMGVNYEDGPCADACAGSGARGDPFGQARLHAERWHP